jgi:hypothetical protein
MIGVRVMKPRCAEYPRLVPGGQMLDLTNN